MAPRDGVARPPAVGTARNGSPAHQNAIVAPSGDAPAGSPRIGS